MSVAEAARRLGVTPTAIRNRIRRGTLTWKPRGNVGKLVQLPQTVERRPAAANRAGRHERLAELQHRFAEAEKRHAGELALERRRSGELRDDFERERERAVRAEKAAELANERAAELRQELAELRHAHADELHQATRLVERIDRLTAEIAQLKARSWWRRLLGG